MNQRTTKKMWAAMSRIWKATGNVQEHNDADFLRECLYELTGKIQELEDNATADHEHRRNAPRR